MTPKQMKIAGKVLDERFDVRSLLVQMFHMAGAIQRILWHLNLPKEDLSLTYQKFADEFKDEVVEEWLKAKVSLERLMTPHHGGQYSSHHGQ